MARLVNDVGLGECFKSKDFSPYNILSLIQLGSRLRVVPAVAQSTSSHASDVHATTVRQLLSISNQQQQVRAALLCT